MLTVNLAGDDDRLLGTTNIQVRYSSFSKMFLFSLTYNILLSFSALDLNE
jgi:hypothetical protein